MGNQKNEVILFYFIPHVIKVNINGRWLNIFFLFYPKTHKRKRGKKKSCGQKNERFLSYMKQKNLFCLSKVFNCKIEKYGKGKQLAVNVKQAAVLATDRPFLVSCSGPSFMTTYE